MLAWLKEHVLELVVGLLTGLGAGITAWFGLKEQGDKNQEAVVRIAKELEDHIKAAGALTARFIVLEEQVKTGAKERAEAMEEIMRLRDRHHAMANLMAELQLHIRAGGRH